MRRFIPLTDELLYEHPELICGPLVPYAVDTPCHRWVGNATTDGYSFNLIITDAEPPNSAKSRRTPQGMAGPFQGVQRRVG